MGSLLSNKTPDTTAKEAKDDSLTEYMGVLYNEIRTLGFKIRLYELFFSWIRHTFKKNCLLVVETSLLQAVRLQ